MGPGHTVAERWSRLQTQGCPKSCTRAVSWAGLLVYDAWPCWRRGRAREEGGCGEAFSFPTVRLPEDFQVEGVQHSNSSGG